LSHPVQEFSTCSKPQTETSDTLKRWNYCNTYACFLHLLFTYLLHWLSDFGRKSA